MSQQLPAGFRLLPEEEKEERPQSQSMARRLAEAGRTMAGFPVVPLQETMLGQLVTSPTTQRMAGLTARGMLQGPASLVGLPFDAATAAYNLATGQRLRQPSQAISQALTDVGLPEPQGVAETAMTAMAGGLPEARTRMTSLLPEALQRTAETPFMGRQNMQDLLVGEAVDAGYVIPPATVGRTTIRENVSGKVMTQQAAASQNQKVTNRLAATALGLPTDRDLSPAAVKEVMNTAGRVYEKVKSNRQFMADDQYLNDLAELEGEALEIARNFPDLKIEGMGEVANLVRGLTQQSFSAKSLVDLVKRLRADAKDNLAFNNANPAERALGRAKLDAAETLEELMARELVRQGDMSLFQEFNNARRLIARAHTVEAAMNPATGNVIASNLAENLRRRKPLTGELALAARFGNAFPSAAQELKSSPVSAMDAAVTALLGTSLGSLPILSGASAPYAAATSLLALGYPAARYGARRSLLGPEMQQSLARRPTPAEGGLLGPTLGATATLGAQIPPQEIPAAPEDLPRGFRLLPEEEYLRGPLSRIIPMPPR
jgi:hypothetical protein